jgi:hypothetical protein
MDRLPGKMPSGYSFYPGFTAPRELITQEKFERIISVIETYLCETCPFVKEQRDVLGLPENSLYLRMLYGEGSPSGRPRDNPAARGALVSSREAHTKSRVALGLEILAEYEFKRLGFNCEASFALMRKLRAELAEHHSQMDLNGAAKGLCPEVFNFRKMDADTLSRIEGIRKGLPEDHQHRIVAARKDDGLFWMFLATWNFTNLPIAGQINFPVVTAPEQF